MATYAEQIGAFESKRAANLAAMDGIMSKSAEDGATLDAAQQEEFDNLCADNEAIDSHLKRLRTLEDANKAAAVPANGSGSQQATESRGGIIVRAAAPKSAPGIEFARLARCKAIGRLDGESPRSVAKDMYGEDSPVFRLLSKAVVVAGTTTDESWAGALVGDETSIFADFVEFLRPQTIVGRFGAGGIPRLRNVPFRTALIGQTSGGAGYWVGEGAAKPLTKFDFERKTLEPLKVANIAVVTEEVLRSSSPSAETILRDQLAAALRERLDIDFIDPNKTAVAGVSPASITQAAVPIPSTGSDADAVREDLRLLFGAFIAANNAPTSGVWIMPATTALSLSLMQNPLGQSEFPGISMSGGTLFGLPVIVSQHMPATYDDSPPTGAVVVLVNASDIYLGDEGGIMVDMSREASLQMDDNPTQASHEGGSPPGVTASTMVSLWQTNSVGFRAERTINWMARRTSAVQVLSGVLWGSV